MFDVIADIIEPTCNIAMDPDAAEIFKRGGCPEGMDPKEYALRRAKEGVPKLMRGHKGDLIAIMAALEGRDPEEYAESVTVVDIVRGLYEMLTDEDLLGFLS